MITLQPASKPGAPRAVAPKVPTTSPGVKPAAKPAVVQAIPPEQVEREIVYPNVEVRMMWPVEAGGQGPITYDLARELLFYETEKEYIARRMAAYAADGKPKPAEAAFKFRVLKGKKMEEVVPVLLQDKNGDLVTTWRNDRNRPFSEPWAMQLAQDMLQGNWAGPSCMPGETVNGETIVISKYGQIESGQHRLVAFILAVQMWRKQVLKWRDVWPNEPVLDALVVLGVSESQKVLQTLDNVKPRTLMDTIYTSTIFKGLSSVERKECSRMLANAVDLLWKRTGAGKSAYQTHSESQRWIELHPTLLKIVKHIFEENTERAISNLNLQPSWAAACCYLMSASCTDGDIYRNADPPAENVIDLSLLDKAMEFWVLLASGAAAFQPIAGTVGKDGIRAGGALLGLADVDGGSTGRQSEKLAVISRAWRLFAESAPGAADIFPEALVTLQDDDYRVDEHGNKHLVPKDENDFGGIDLGPGYAKAATEDDGPTETEIAEWKEAEAARLRQELADKAIANARAKAAKKAAKQVAPKDLPPQTKLSPAAQAILDAKAKTRKQIEADQTAKAAELDKRQHEAWQNQPAKPAVKPVTPVGKPKLKGGIG